MQAQSGPSRERRPGPLRNDSLVTFSLHLLLFAFQDKALRLTEAGSHVKQRSMREPDRFPWSCFAAFAASWACVGGWGWRANDCPGPILAAALLRRFRLGLMRHQTHRLFAASCSSPHIDSAFVTSHRTSIVTFRFNNSKQFRDRYLDQIFSMMRFRMFLWQRG